MFSHRATLSVSWGDCDPAGIVFYPRYFEWFDRLTHALLAAAGVPHGPLLGEGALGLGLVDASARFRAPARPGDTLTAHSQIQALTTRSVRVSHALRRGDELCVEGEEVRVWLVAHPEGLRAGPLPAEVRARLETP